MAQKPFVTVNGVAFPTPAFGSGKFTISTNVNAGRNANGTVIGQRVGRDIVKIEMSWNVLDLVDWKKIITTIGNNPMNLKVQYFDYREGAYKTCTMYAGDRSCDPYTINEDGSPTFVVNCSVKLIDKGEI